jgi:hypothetical protein
MIRIKGAGHGRIEERLCRAADAKLARRAPPKADKTRRLLRRKRLRACIDPKFRTNLFAA